MNNSFFRKLKEIPNPPEEVVDDPNPGVRLVVYTHRSRLPEIMAVVNECGGWTVVQPQKLPETNEWYLTVLVPYGRTKHFQDRILDEGLNFVPEKKPLDPIYEAQRKLRG